MTEGNRFAFYEKEADRNQYFYFEKVVCTETMTFPPHFHDSIEIVMVTKGTFEIYINGIQNTFNEGDCAFINCFEVHYYKYAPNCEYYVFVISKEYLTDESEFRTKKLNTFLPRCTQYPQLKALFDTAYELSESANELFKKGLINMVLGAMSGIYPLTIKDGRGDFGTLVQALQFINHHFAEEITLEFLSRRFGYSKTYFSTLFNRFAGMNLRDYLNQRRLGEFQRLKKENPTLTISTLAQQCGFKSLKTFYRACNKQSKQMQ